MPTKAETLIKLKKYEKKIGFVVPKIFFFTKKNYEEKKEKYLKKIKIVFKNKKIIIRSSSKNEDQENKSNAGKYISFQNVSSNDISIDEKILLILKQYDSPNDQVIVQEFIENPNISGVIFTRNINNNSPYYFLNIDSSGKTDLITSGKLNPSMKTLVFFRDITKYKIPKKYFSLIKKIKQIENIFRNDRLDLEFCIKKKINNFSMQATKKNEKN